MGGKTQLSRAVGHEAPGGESPLHIAAGLAEGGHGGGILVGLPRQRDVDHGQARRPAAGLPHRGTGIGRIAVLGIGLVEEGQMAAAPLVTRGAGRIVRLVRARGGRSGIRRGRGDARSRKPQPFDVQVRHLEDSDQHENGERRHAQHRPQMPAPSPNAAATRGAARAGQTAQHGPHHARHGSRSRERPRRPARRPPLRRCTLGGFRTRATSRPTPRALRPRPSVPPVGIGGNPRSTRRARSARPSGAA